MIMMSSANTTVLAFVTFESSVMRSPIIIFHRVGPETDPWGHPFLTLLELIVFFCSTFGILFNVKLHYMFWPAQPS
jgi:hypothetical protein